MSDVTIVISNYNYAEYVGAAIESCLTQTHSCDIIVVDDASTDGSWNIVSSLCKEKNITGIRLNANSGGNSRGKNVGIVLSKTPYIACLDSDDMLLPRSIQDRLDIFSTFPQAEFVHGCCIRSKCVLSYRDVLKSIQKQANSVVAMNGFQDYRSIPENDIAWYRGVAASTVLAKRDLYKTFGLYDEKCGKEDREMWYRWISHGACRKYLHKNVSVYRLHARQITRNPQRKKPKEVDAYFTKVIGERLNILPSNTLLYENFDPEKYIDQKVN